MTVIHFLFLMYQQFLRTIIKRQVWKTRKIIDIYTHKDYRSSVKRPRVLWLYWTKAQLHHWNREGNIRKGFIALLTLFMDYILSSNGINREYLNCTEIFSSSAILRPQAHTFRATTAERNFAGDTVCRAFVECLRVATLEQNAELL